MQVETYPFPLSTTRENGKVLYLTASRKPSGASNNASGKAPGANGNVYWSSTRTANQNYQKWRFSEVSGGGSGTYDKNYLTYPTSTMNISQSYDGTRSHFPYSSGTPRDYPIDELCENDGRSWFLCPCDEMKVVRVYTAGINTVWLESTSPVVTPSGTSIITIMVMHPEDDDLLPLKNSTKLFKRGEAMFREGNDGYASGQSDGNHFHISVGTGSYNGGAYGNGWEKNSKDVWVLTPTGKTLKPEQAFYVDPQKKTIVNRQGLSFQSI